MSILDSGESVRGVAHQFRIGKTTIYEWQKRRFETGDFRSKKQGNKGYNHKILDWEGFRGFVSRHGDKTQAEMAELWEGDISRQTIHRALKMIGFTRKKRLTVIRKGMKASEQNF